MHGTYWPVDPTAYLWVLWEVFLWSAGSFLVIAIVIAVLYEIFRPDD